MCVNETISYLNEGIKNLENKSKYLDDPNKLWEDVKSAYHEVQEIKNKSILLNKAGKLKRAANKCVEKIQEYRDIMRQRTILKVRLDSAVAVRRHLEKWRNALESLLKDIQAVKIDSIQPPNSPHIILPNIKDLVVPDFKLDNVKLENLNLSTIKEEWLSKVDDRIEKKVKEAFQPDLSLFRFDNVPEGWSPVDEISSMKIRKEIAVVPRYAKIRNSKLLADSLIQKDDGFDVTIYRFVLGIRVEEIEIL